MTIFIVIRNYGPALQLRFISRAISLKRFQSTPVYKKMFEKIKRIFRREKSNEQEAIAGGRRKSLLERVRRSIIPDDLTFSR